MEVYFCDQCPGVELTFVERLKNTKPQNGLPFGNRVRRFICPVCDTPKTIFSTGERDDEIHPDIIQDELKEMFRQETTNRE